MIAVIDAFGGLASPDPSTDGAVGVFATFITVPPAALPKLRALLAVTQAAARVRRVALRAIARGKSARFVTPLLRAHERLVQKQASLAESVAALLAAAT